jgi:hypothetical protein
MVLRNTSASVVTARSRFLDGAGGTIAELLPQTISPHEDLEVDLSPLITASASTDPGSVGVQVLNDGAPGSLIGALYSQSRTKNLTYDIPLRDSGTPRSSTGAYPVRLDGDYTTILSITNVSDRKGKFVLQINYGDNQKYELGLLTPNPGETKTYDLRRLRDDQTPDREGNPFPRNLTVGQVRWSMLGNGSVPLFGRVAIASLKETVSSSYSCIMCCPNSFSAGRIDPNYIPLFRGNGQQVHTQEQERDCYGNIYGWYDVDANNWSSSDTTVADVDFSGFINPGEVGSATIYSARSTDLWLSGFDQCFYDQGNDTESTNAEVTSPVTFLDASEEGGSVSEFFGGYSVTTLNITSCGGERFGVKIRFRVDPGATITKFDSTVSSSGMFATAPSPVDNTYVEYYGADNPPYTKTYLRKVRDTGSRAVIHTLEGTSDNKSFKASATVTLVCQ